MDNKTPAEQAQDALIERLMREGAARDEFMSVVAEGRLSEAYFGQTLNSREPTDVARIMREGKQDRPMLLDGWIAADELHWMFAEPGEGKTWFGLWIAKQVVEAGDLVVWVDEELGVDTTAERLLLLGADPDVVERRFVYFAYPGWLREAGDAERWAALMQLVKPALVVMDTATDALAEAGLNENDGREVTAWVKTFCEPPRRAGAAVLVLDHVPKSGESRGYAVGSRAKKAKAKVMFELKTRKKFGPDRVGLVEAKVVKNGIGASVPDKDDPVSYRVGGEDGGFVIKPASELESALAVHGDRESKRLQLQQDIVAVIRRAEGQPLTKSQIKDQVSGNGARKVEALEAIAASPDYWGVKVTPKGNSLVFQHVGDNDVPKVPDE